MKGVLLVGEVMTHARRAIQLVDVLDQPAAADHVGDLMPQANREDRDPFGVGPSEEIQLEPVAAGVQRARARVRLLAETVRGQVVAAGEDQPVVAGEQVVEQFVVLFGRDGDGLGCSADREDRVAVAGQQVGLRPRRVFPVQAEVAGKPDDWSHGFSASQAVQRGARRVGRFPPSGSLHAASGPV
jgi:hypothetical protein